MHISPQLNLHVATNMQIIFLEKQVNFKFCRYIWSLLLSTRKLIMEIKREGKWTTNSRIPLAASQRRKDDKSMLLNTRPWSKSPKGMPVQTHSLIAVPVWPQKSSAIRKAMSSKVMVALPTPGRNVFVFLRSFCATQSLLQGWGSVSSAGPMEPSAHF